MTIVPAVSLPEYSTICRRSWAGMEKLAFGSRTTLSNTAPELRIGPARPSGSADAIVLDAATAIATAQTRRNATFRTGMENPLRLWPFASTTPQEVQRFRAGNLTISR